MVFTTLLNDLIGKLAYRKPYLQKLHCRGFMFHLKFTQNNPECEEDPVTKTGRFDCHRGK